MIFVRFAVISAVIFSIIQVLAMSPTRAFAASAAASVGVTLQSFASYFSILFPSFDDSLVEDIFANDFLCLVLEAGSKKTSLSISIIKRGRWDASHDPPTPAHDSSHGIEFSLSLSIL